MAEKEKRKLTTNHRAEEEREAFKRKRKAGDCHVPALKNAIQIQLVHNHAYR